MTDDQWAAIAERRLTPRRFAHVRGVRQTAEQLARRYGCDPASAALAGWLHDMYRELPADEMRKLAQESSWTVPSTPEPTWHGPLCARRLSVDFGIEDAEIADAVRYHTLGDPTMSRLAFVLYVADAIEPTREYPGVAQLRRAADISLELAVAVITDHMIHHLLDRREWVALSTVELRNHVWPYVTPEDLRLYEEGNLR